jgi:hypothetical protein
MAILNPNKNGYAVVEINKLNSRTTGLMVANAPLATDFTCDGKEKGQTYAENGMILAYDPTNTKGNENGAIVATKMSDVNPTAIGLVYATEHMYNTYANALKDFKIDRPVDKETEITPYEAIYGQQRHFQFYPRLFMLTPSDTFTTDAVDLGTYKDVDAVKEALEAGTAIYGTVGNGYTVLGSEAGPLKVQKITTLPDGITPAIKFQVVDTTLA